MVPSAGCNLGCGHPGSEVAHRHAPVADGDRRRGRLAMVSTRTTAKSQREVQRLDCSVPGLWLSWLQVLVVHILVLVVRPLGVVHRVALVLYWKQRAWRGQGAAVAGLGGK